MEQDHEKNGSETQKKLQGTDSDGICHYGSDGVHDRFGFLVFAGSFCRV